MNKGNGMYFRGTEVERLNFMGEQSQYWGTGNIRKQNLREQRNKPIISEEQETCTPPP